MTRRSPCVRNGMLVDPAMGGSVAVGSQPWFGWLEQRRSFRFESAAGSFSARKEQRPGGWYWYASRRTKGVLHITYLGRSGDLTLERLKEIALQLAPDIGEQTTLERSPQQERSAWYDPLLATKLAIPRLRSTLVLRPRLTAWLRDVPGYKLTLLVAPAGYGKTTLLAAWLNSEFGVQPSELPERPAEAHHSPLTTQNYHVAWVSLDQGDDNPLRCWSYIAAALAAHCPSVEAQALPLLRAPQPAPIESTITALINQLMGLAHDIVLVLDDYHAISAPAIHTSLTFLLDHLPPRLHLVIASREEPPLALARLRARGEVRELRAADLRFSLAEAATFLHDVMALSLAPEQVAALERQTEGWVAGLQLAALSLRQHDDSAGFIRAFSGADRMIVEYFAQEVLHQQPAMVQQFLLHTSILERMSGPLCDAIIGDWESEIGDAWNEPFRSQSLLEYLDRANLFVVSLDSERRWYRYHQLFGDWLRRRLRSTQPEHVAELHRRASAWFASQGLTDEAIDHALAAEDFALAAQLLDKPVARRLWYGEAASLLRWLKALPMAQLQAHPLLGIAHAKALLELSRFVDARPITERAAAILDTTAHMLDPADRLRARVAVAVIRATVALNLGDPLGAIAESNRALQLLPADDGLLPWLIAQVSLNLADAYKATDNFVAARVAFADAIDLNQAVGNVTTAITAMSGLGDLQIRQGQLHTAARTLRQAFGLAAAQASPPPSVGKAHIYFGALLYEWNDLAGAARHLRSGVEFSRQWGHAFHVVEGQIFLALVQAAQRDADGALATLDHALRDADMAGRSVIPQEQNQNLQRLLELIADIQAQLYLARGDLDAAQNWALRRRRSLDAHADWRTSSQGRTLATLLIALGRPDEAAALLDAVAQDAEAHDRFGQAVWVRTAQAAALELNGATERALAALALALRHGEVGGAIRAFLDAGPLIHRLLHLAAARNSSDYVDLLLAAFRSELGQPELIVLEGDQLSEREIEVLRLMAAGKTNPTIAAELVVAVSTVRTHIKHIYAKLHAHSRAEALTRASTLGLV